jgi:uncharacterized protein YcbK (DUF882 family)
VVPESKCKSTFIDRSFSRRRILTSGVLAAATWLSPRLTWARRGVASSDHLERTLAFYNTHTREELKTVYWREGGYVTSSLTDLDYLLRDHRANQLTLMDPRLFDLLYAIQEKLNLTRPFHVISGYRSPETNAYLRRRSRGVAKNSLHMQGKAIDIRIPGYQSKELKRVALSLGRGGVGYYARSNFVHVDLGRVRHW